MLAGASRSATPGRSGSASTAVAGASCHCPRQRPAQPQERAKKVVARLLVRRRETLIPCDMSRAWGFRAEGVAVHRLVVLVALCAAFLVVPQIASATVAGENGRIAFVRDGDIWTVNRAG